MSVFNLLTEQDKDLIFEYIYSYGATGMEALSPERSNIATILREWDTQKSRYLQKLFGGENLILSRPYTYTMSADGVQHNILQAIDKEGDLYYTPMRRAMLSIANTYLDFEFATSEPLAYAPDVTFVHNLFYAETLASNSYSGPVGKVIFDDGDVMKLTVGMKPMKIMRKLVDKYASESVQQLFEFFRNWHSQLLNQIHLDGTLSISIHPLDYMTMSDNGGSWDSCMRWMNDRTHTGDYRMGTVACLNSPYVVVAYLHNPDKQFEFYNSHTNESAYWNKKKWRELFIVQDGVISEVKGYPFQDENLTNTVLMWLKELAHQNLGWEYENVEYNVASEFAHADKDQEAKRFKLHFKSDFMYNDFGTLDKHRARLNFTSLARRSALKGGDVLWVETPPFYGEETSLQRIQVPYSGTATCMCCGETVEYDEERGNAVFCTRCDALRICSCCGEYISGDEFYVTAYNGLLCTSCYEYECSIDELSEDYEVDFSLQEIRLLLGYDSYGNKIFSRAGFTTLNPLEYPNENWDHAFTQGCRTEKRYYNYIYFVTIDDFMKASYWNTDLFDSFFDIRIDSIDDDWFEDLMANYASVVDWDVTPTKIYDVLGIPFN